MDQQGFRKDKKRAGPETNPQKSPDSGQKKESGQDIHPVGRGRSRLEERMRKEHAHDPYCD
jgi:hypothetical protein